MAGKENRRQKRLYLDRSHRVIMGSIGAGVRYELSTRNVSSTGFFLEFERPSRFPFNESSIMEVWLEIDEGQNIFFNGKMARVVKPEDPEAQETGPGIAISIVQISKEDEAKFKDFLKSHKDSDDKAKPVA